MNDDYKITVDWSNIKDQYIDAGIDISPLIMPRDESLMIKCDDHCYDSICTAATRSYVDEHKAEIKELKQKLEEAEHANEIMRTDSKAMAEGLVRRDDKIKALEAEVAELKAMIEYCKENGIWAEMPIPQMPLLNKVFPTLVSAQDEDDAAHLLDGLEIDDEDKN